MVDDRQRMRTIAEGLRLWGAALLAVGLVLVLLSFAAGPDEPCPFGGCGPRPLMGLLMFGGFVTTTGLVLLSYGFAGPYARFVVAQVEPVRIEVEPASAAACAACGKASAGEGRYCPHCGRERVLTSP